MSDVSSGKSPEDEDEDILAEIGRKFSDLDLKIGKILAEKQKQFDLHLVQRIEKLINSGEINIIRALKAQRNVLLDRVNCELRQSLNCLKRLSNLTPGLDCAHILNDCTQLIGNLKYFNTFSLLKKFAYYPFLNEFTLEIKFDQNAQCPEPIKIVRILVIVTNRLFVYLYNRDERCFKIFNLKWDELNSIQIDNDLNFKNILSDDNKIICLFSKNHKHLLNVYDDQLNLLESKWFDIEINLCSINDDNEIICWSVKEKQMLVFDYKLDLVNTIGQDKDPNEPFYFASLILLNASSKIMLFYSCNVVNEEHCLQIMNRKTGLIQGSINMEFNYFPKDIKIDLHSNILFRKCDQPLAHMLRYFDSYGNLLVEFGNDQFTRFDRIDLNKNQEELICFSFRAKNILFF